MLCEENPLVSVSSPRCAAMLKGLYVAVLAPLNRSQMLQSENLFTALDPKSFIYFTFQRRLLIMTIARSNGSNGSNCSQFPIISDLAESINSRPDRNTHNGRQPDLRPPTEAHMEQMMDAVRSLLVGVGEDPQREGLLKTPYRVAEAMRFLTSGYNESLEEIVNNAIFDEGHNEMVLVRDINFFSLCEHHMLPFMGRAHVAYIPNQKVVGLSKLARIVEMYSRRLQVQERLTRQIAEAVQLILEPQGVAVVLEATHMCMVMRGVQKPGSWTVTSAMLGIFQDEQKTREEFFNLIRHQAAFF